MGHAVLEMEGQKLQVLKIPGGYCIHFGFYSGKVVEGVEPISVEEDFPATELKE